MKLLFSIMMLINTTFWPFDANILPGDSLVIVNKKSNQLVLFEGGQIVLESSIASGKTNELTPEGLFSITVKAINPYYRKLDIPGGSPLNPLGSRWIGFDARGTDGRTYGVHGTNQPQSIGQYISQGCIRMPKKELEQLYDRVLIGTKILIVNSSESMEELAKKYGAI
ncbi:L,D-transpeptidase [Lederbergia graminis]|uniref:L,D-transpeptidase n=1 Tax=Lederbergia graminis TaxID=735518 RepID=A0ABW0LBG2_9BACI|nr:L,D-transpeptidase [Paenibacillus bovis]HLU23459.1 L,D-transpeptidase [Bacillaceae bacterium]